MLSGRVHKDPWPTRRTPTGLTQAVPGLAPPIGFSPPSGSTGVATFRTENISFHPCQSLPPRL
eukprot:5580149-Prymnesium_polylepis.1